MSGLINIIIGIFGLGIVVFVHEAGHFIAAKLCGVKVLAFSIGWGKKLWSFKKGDTEYCISMLPMGGYCKMKGEEVLDDRTEYADNTGALSAAPSWKKMIIYFAGPFMNLVFAIIAFSIISTLGSIVHSPDSRLILASEYSEEKITYPADTAGLKTGDCILKVNSQKIENFQDVRMAIAANAKEKIFFTVERDGKELTLEIVPELDKSSGTGRIGVYPWLDPVIGEIAPNSSAYIAGLKSGDTIVEAGGKKIVNYMDFAILLREKPTSLDLTVLRDNQKQNLTMVFDYNENGIVNPGMQFKLNEYIKEGQSLGKAFKIGTQDAVNTLRATVKGLKLLFAGVDLKNALSGPIRISYLMGEATSQGFSESLHAGLESFLTICAYINIALFFMNMLPIPALDGGQILFCFIEVLRRKKFKSTTSFRFQVVGFSIMIALMIFTVFNDVIFLIKK